MLKLVKPSIIYQEQLIEIIDEFNNAKSEFSGGSRLQDYRENIAGWLERLEEDKNPSDPNRVPGESYLLVNEENVIIGMINIRIKLNEALAEFGGNIGYSIRPSMRRRGYNKINLYLALKRCLELGMNVVLLDCRKSNIGSSKSMEALGGKLIKEFYREEYQEPALKYEINVLESVNKYKEVYEPLVKKMK